MYQAKRYKRNLFGSSKALSRDACNFLQDGLKKLILYSFENLLHHTQKRLYLQREIKPIERILQVFGRISAQCQQQLNNQQSASAMVA